MFAGPLAVARQLGGPGGARRAVESVGLHPRRGFEGLERPGGLVHLEQHIAQQLARRHDRAWRDRVLLGLVLELDRLEHELQRLLVLALDPVAQASTTWRWISVCSAQ